MKRIIGRIFAIFPAVVLQVLWYVFIWKFLNSIFPFVNELLTICALLFVLSIVSDFEEANYKIMWILIILPFPIFGAWLYMNFGNRRTAKPLDKKITKTKHELNYKMETNSQIQEDLKQKNIRFSQTLQSIGNPITYIKDIQYYSLGDSCFPDMVKAIESAKKFVYIEYFIIEEGIFFNTLVDILKEKVKEGVDVRIIYDDIGSVTTYSIKNIKKLNTYGIQCIPFNPLVFVRAELNNRDHRKMLIVDNEVCFSGGINIADEYINVKEKYGHWKDIAFRITGDAVNQYTYMFIELWNAFSNQKIPKENLLHAFENKNTHKGYIVSYYDSPAKKRHISRQLLLDTFSCATKRVWIYTPYLILGDSLMESLCTLALRGVDVRIMIPGIPDKKMVYRMSLSYCRSLIEAGVKIYQYTPGFLHAKAWLIDDDICTIGTVNLDYRSLFLHFECNSIFYECDVFKDLEKDMKDTMSKSYLMKKEDLNSRILYQLFDKILRIFAPLF